MNVEAERMTDMNLKEKIDNARALSVDLKDATDRLNALLSEVETRLLTLGLGVSEWVPLGVADRLEFRKVGDTWGLYVNGVHIQHVSRALRCRAAVKLPDLVEAMAQKVLSETETVRNAAAQVDAILKDLTVLKGAQ